MRGITGKRIQSGGGVIQTILLYENMQWSGNINYISIKSAAIYRETENQQRKSVI
jgi:hypothetical protein